MQFMGGNDIQFDLAKMDKQKWLSIVKVGEQILR